MDRQMLLSVVIPTYGRRGSLQRCLEALERQTLTVDAAFEVVVVVDGSTDGTCEWLDAYPGPLRLRAVAQVGNA